MERQAIAATSGGPAESGRSVGPAALGLDAAVLVADDDRSLLEILRQVLAELGPRVEVITASSGTEALALIAARGVDRPIDVLITDQKMPGMSGLELVAEARRGRPALQSILLTAYTGPEELLQAINEGHVFRYLVKPWKRAELLATVRQALAAAAMRSERDALLTRMARRLRTMSALVELSTQATAPQTQAQLLDRVHDVLDRVVSFEIATTLLVPPSPGGKGGPARASMLVMLRRPGAPDETASAQEACLRLYNDHSGLAPLSLAEIDVRFAAGAADASTGATERGTLASALRAAPRAVLSALIGQADDAAAARAVPRGGVVGALYLGSPTGADGRARYDADDAQNLEALAAQIAHLTHHLTERLVDERRRMELMVASMADGVIMTDQAGEIFLINPSARRMLSLPPAEASAPPITAKFLKERLGFYPFELVRAGLRHDGPLREEVRIGEQYLHSIISPVISDSGGELVGVVVVLRDITDQKALESRKEEFVSIVSHELRTPLTSIGGALELLVERYDEGLSEKQRRYIQMARDSSQKLNRIVDDLLDVSRAERGRLQLRTGAIDLGELCAQAAERFRGAAEQKHTELVVRSTGAVHLEADADRLTQVLSNLLSNAIKFTSEGGRIELEAFGAAATAELVGLSVWNSGPAIAAADRERVFDKFEQVQASATRRVGGTGLGLAISRGIVERHSGQIWVEPSPSGTRFVATLPVRAHETPEPRSSDLAPPLSLKKSILVVEDEPHSAWLLKGALLGARYAVQVAADPESALMIAREQRPDLITVDLQMPGASSGLELVEILRHDPETRKVPLLVISGSGELSSSVLADAVLRKPVTLTQVRETVLTLFSEAGQLRRRILVIDDDTAIRLICREVLEAHGFLVREAEDGPSALTEARRFRPDLVLVDVMMPGMDGFSLAQRLRGERDTSLVPIIFVSARGQTADKVRAFKLGAEDYMVKPFDSAELVARVEKALLRRDFDLGASPTTRLPGSQIITQETERRLQAHSGFAFCYLDLDNLKAFNDYYGYAKADAVIRQTGDIIREAVARHGTSDDFIGHIAGDDFVLITSTERADAVCAAVIDSFDRLVPLYYNQSDRERGYIEARDRFGEMRRFPIMSVSIACVIGDERTRSHAELSSLAAELKQQAKAVVGSSYVRDGRVVLPRPTVAARPVSG